MGAELHIYPTLTHPQKAHVTERKQGWILLAARIYVYLAALFIYRVLWKAQLHAAQLHAAQRGAEQELCQRWVVSGFTLQLYHTIKSRRLLEGESVTEERYKGRRIGEGKRRRSQRRTKAQGYLKCYQSFFEFTARPLAVLLRRGSQKECLHGCREDTSGKESLQMQTQGQSEPTGGQQEPNLAETV